MWKFGGLDAFGRPPGEMGGRPSIPPALPPVPFPRGRGLSEKLPFADKNQNRARAQTDDVFNSTMITRYSRLRWLRAPFLALALLCTTGLPHLRADDPKPDPAGTATGVAADVPGFVMTAPAELSADDKKDKDKVKAYDDAKKMADDYAAQAKPERLAVKLAENVGHHRVAINFMWTLFTGFLVMFMQAGFALVETGLCRAKNAAHTMAMNFMIYPMGMLGFYLCGFAFMFGGLADSMIPNTSGIA